MKLAETLAEIAEMSRNGAAERDIETEVVQVFKMVGWPRLQVNWFYPPFGEAARFTGLTKTQPVRFIAGPVRP